MVGNQFPTQLEAKVTDAGSNPLQGVGVLFTAPGSGASLTFQGGTNTILVSTNSAGIATAPTATANMVSGSYDVVATIPTAPGVTGANFAMTNSPAPTVGSLSVSVDFPTVGLTRSMNGTVSLSAPAPEGGLIVMLSTTPAGIVTVPASLTVAAGANSATFTVTGAATGSATILAVAPRYTDGSVNVDVRFLGAITLPIGITVGPNRSVPFPVSLVTGAPLGGVTISLISSDTSKVTISPATVVIPQFATTPATQPQVTGVALGTATISASAPGFIGDSQPVQVAAVLSFSPETLTIATGATQNLNLTLSGVAPSGGLTISVSSSNTGAATVPPIVTMLQNTSTVAVPVTGVGPGTAVIHASAPPSLPDTTATVTVVNLGAVILPSNASVALGQSTSLAVSLSQPAPAGGVTVNLSSSDAARVGVLPSIVVVAMGQTTPGTQPQITGVNVGSAIVTASANGYTSGSTPVLVSAALSFSPQDLTIYAGATQNLTLTLSAPAPAAGIAVNVSSSNTGVASVPASVTFTSGASIVNVPVTGVAEGTAVIHASGTNIPDATANVAVLGAAPSTIILPSSTTLGLGQSAAFNVALSTPAPIGGITVNFSISDVSKVAVSPTSVSIPQGATSPSAQPQVTGVNLGSVTIAASAAGYNPATAAVQVSASISFSPQDLTVRPGATQNLALTLSGTAPSGGLAINLTSSNPGVATVPLTVTFAAGSSIVNVPVTGVTAGNTVIHASALPAIADTTANVAVRSAIVLPTNLTVELGQTVAFPVTLDSPAPTGGVFISLTTSDISKVTISPATVTISEGQTMPAATPRVTGVGFGTVSISAAATGYATVSAPVQVTASLNFAPSSLNVIGTGTHNLSLLLSAPAPSGGLTVNLTSSNPAAITVPASATIQAGSNNTDVPVTAVALGTATVTAAPSISGVSNATANITVSAPGAITLSLVAVGLGNSAAFPITLGTPAPTGGVTVTLSSADTSKVTVSPSSVFVEAGQTAPAVPPQVSGLDVGPADVTASAPGYTSATATVTVNATMTFSPPSLTIVGTTTQNLSLALSAAAPASGLTISLSSSNPAVAAVPFTLTFFPDGSSFTTLVVPVTGIAPGTTVIRAGAPPYVPEVTAIVTVVSPGAILLPPNITVAPGQSAEFSVTLGTPAPSGGVTVTLASSDTSKLTISPSNVTIAAGQASPTTLPQVTGVDFGSATISASAPGYTPASQAVQVAATMTFSPQNLSISAGATQNLTLTLSAQAPAGGLTVNLSSGNPAFATVPSSVTFAAGANTVNVPVTGVTPGPTTITASTSVPNIPNATANVTVQSAGAIELPSSTTVGLGQSAAFAVTLPAPAPSNVTVTLTSSDTSKVTVAPGIVTILAGQTAPAAQPQVAGVNLGTANITATATGYTQGSSPVQVTASISFTQQNLTITGFTTQNLTLNLSGPAPSAGLTVGVSSSNPAVATVPVNVSFAAGTSIVTVPVTGVALGTAVIHASAPNLADTTANVTVTTGGGINLTSNVTVGLEQSAEFAVSLSTAAPFGVTVTLESSDTSKVTISPSTLTINAGQTAPASQPLVTGVGLGTANINASAPAYTSASAPVLVTATVSFTPQNVTINGLSTQNLTLTLSAPAPLGGVTIDLSSSNQGVVTVPPTVTLTAGATTVAVPVTALALGNSVIHASASPSIPDATANVTVQSGGPIGLPSGASVGLGQSAAFAVTLPLAAQTNVTVSLTSGDPSNVTISPATVTINAGQTTPVSQPQVTGVNIGTAAITASAPGYTSSSASVQVNATVSFTPQSLTITGLNIQNLTLALSAAAPSGGVTVNVSSSNTGVATVPSTVTFAAGATSVAVPVTGASIGAAVIHASASPFIPDATANVTVQSAGPVGLPSGAAVGLGQSAAFTVALPLAAPAGGVTVALTSSDSTRVTVTPSTVTVNAGQTTPASQPQVTGVNVGSASITASAPGYTSSTAAVQVSASVSFTPQNVTINPSSIRDLTLNLSAAAPTGGLTVNLSSSNPAVASVPATATFTAGSNSVSVPVTALTPGPAVIHASGTNIPDATANVTVTSNSQAITLTNASVGKDLEVSVSVSIPNPAPTGGQRITLTSGNPSALLIAGRPGDVGTASLIITIPEGLTAVSGVYLQGLVSTGATTLTASAGGFVDGVATITLTPSGFVLSGPNGVGGSSMSTSPGVSTTMTVYPARLDAALNRDGWLQGLRQRAARGFRSGGHPQHVRRRRRLCRRRDVRHPG